MTIAEPVTRRPLDDERIDRRLARIRDLFARWAALRPGDGEVWRTGFSPVPETEVVAAETRLGLRLPENYRRYLLEFGEPAHLLMAYAGRLVGEQKGHATPDHGRLRSHGHRRVRRALSARTRGVPLRHPVAENDDTFVHLALADDSSAPLPDLPAFRAFQLKLGSRVSAPPRRSEARIVGNYRLL